MDAGSLLLGLSLGGGVAVSLYAWQRRRFNRSLKALLLQPNLALPDYPSTPLSTLASAISHQHQRFLRLESDLIALNRSLNQAPIGYLMVSSDNHLIFCNPRACELLDIPEWHQSNRLFLEVVRSYEVDQLIEQARRSQQPCEQTWNFQILSSSRSGQDTVDPAQPPTRQLRGKSIPLPHQQVGVFIEDRQEVMQLTQQRDRWISDVAHELRTPLTSVRLITETLQSRVAPGLQSWMDRLVKEVIRLSQLVEDLLELGALKAGASRSYHYQPVDLVALIHTAWNCVEPLARQQQVQFSYQGPQQLIFQADESRFHRLLLNLLDNGVKFSPPNQPIQVRVSTHTYLDPQLPRWAEYQMQQADNWIYLQIIDAGCGFNEKDVPYIFERFYRADTSRARPLATSISLYSASNQTASSEFHSGSGLGLAIARQIISDHHGLIHASNSLETGGAWLEVLLPWEQ